MPGILFFHFSQGFGCDGGVGILDDRGRDFDSYREGPAFFRTTDLKRPQGFDMVIQKARQKAGLFQSVFRSKSGNSKIHFGFKI